MIDIYQFVKLSTFYLWMARDRKWFSKCLYIASRILETTSTCASSSKIDAIAFLRRLPDIIAWKYLELALPSQSHNNLDCWHGILALIRDSECRSEDKPCIHSTSSSDSTSLSPLASNNEIFSFKELFLPGKLWVWVRCHSLRAVLVNFNFSFNTKPP